MGFMEFFDMEKLRASAIIFHPFQARSLTKSELDTFGDMQTDVVLPIPNGVPVYVIILSGDFLVIVESQTRLINTKVHFKRIRKQRF